MLCMRDEINFKIFGIFVFLFQLMMGFVFLVGQSREPFFLNNHTIIRISSFFLLTTIVGIGLIYLRKWAAICFSLAISCFSLWLIIGSILYVPFFWSFINFFIGIISLIPVFITIRLWSLLSWNGKRLQ